MSGYIFVYLPKIPHLTLAFNLYLVEADIHRVNMTEIKKEGLKPS